MLNENNMNNNLNINTLNSKEIDGNTLNIPIHELDLYHCPSCNEDVVESEWNDKKNICYSCWWKI